MDCDADTSKVALKQETFDQLKVALQAQFGGSGVPGVLADDLSNAEFFRNCAADAVGEIYPNAIDHTSFGELTADQQTAQIDNILLKAKQLYNSRYESKLGLRLQQNNLG